MLELCAEDLGNKEANVWGGGLSPALTQWCVWKPIPEGGHRAFNSQFSKWDTNPISTTHHKGEGLYQPGSYECEQSLLLLSPILHFSVGCSCKKRLFWKRNSSSLPSYETDNEIHKRKIQKFFSSLLIFWDMRWARG